MPWAAPHSDDGCADRGYFADPVLVPLIWRASHCAFTATTCELGERREPYRLSSHMSHVVTVPSPCWSRLPFCWSYSRAARPYKEDTRTGEPYCCLAVAITVISYVFTGTAQAGEIKEKKHRIRLRMEGE